MAIIPSLAINGAELSTGAGALLPELSREQFAAAQTRMSQDWYINLLRSGRNVEDHIEKRRAAYLVRWREAGRYIGHGGRVLDVGGGNLYPDLLAYFRSMDWDYWYVDIGEGETRAAAELAASLGFEPAQFSRRLNHELDYPEAAFDAVFSSHCIEHSMDLPLTLRQLNRILRPGGTLVISVPLGWDAQPNHPYFLMENEWLTLLEDAGFRIRAYQIGDEYPETGEDLLIAAERAGPLADRFRVDIQRHVKSNYRFRSFRDPALRRLGEWVDRDDHLILQGPDWGLDIALEAGVTEALPVFIRHSWSGVVSLRSGADMVYGDLFRPRAATQPLRLTLSTPAEAGQIVEVRPVGRNELSAAAQGVLLGVMTR